MDLPPWRRSAIRTNAALHGSIALTSDGPHAAIALDSFFALHPAMPEFARMYRDNKAAVVHAVATAYRERSHLRRPGCLESALPGRGGCSRAGSIVPGQPAAWQRVMSGLASVPPRHWCCRGAAPTVGWAPATLRGADDTAMRTAPISIATGDPAQATRSRRGLQIEKRSPRAMTRQ